MEFQFPIQKALINNHKAHKKNKRNYSTEIKTTGLIIKYFNEAINSTIKKNCSH